MKNSVIFVIVTVLVLSITPGHAHHSWPAVFKEEEIVIQGVVTEFLLRSPHSWLIVNATGSDGKTERWDIEMGPAMAYAKSGVNEDTFKAGDKLIVLGNPGRKHPRWLHFRGMYRESDGWVFGRDPREAGGKE